MSSLVDPANRACWLRSVRTATLRLPARRLVPPSCLFHDWTTAPPCYSRSGRPRVEARSRRVQRVSGTLCQDGTPRIRTKYAFSGRTGARRTEARRVAIAAGGHGGRGSGGPSAGCRSRSIQGRRPTSGPSPGRAPLARSRTGWWRPPPRRDQDRPTAATAAWIPGRGGAEGRQASRPSTRIKVGPATMPALLLSRHPALLAS
jgi:hypothetical protein